VTPAKDHTSNNDLAPFLRPTHADRGDLDDCTRDARIERRIGRRLTVSESHILKCRRTPPMPLESRAYYHARGFQLIALRGQLVMVKNGFGWWGGRVAK